MIIGLTGGIGSGKSVISNQLRQMGYEVYDTDSQAKRLIVEDTQVSEQITGLFGLEAYQDGIYQTAFVAQKVFADKTLLARLNAIVHPAVRQDIIKRYSTELTDINRPVFIECAILYQAGIDQVCDKVIVVTAPEEVRLERTIARDHSNVDKVRARMSAQNVEADLRRADIIINNDGTTPIPILCEQILKELT